MNSTGLLLARLSAWGGDLLPAPRLEDVEAAERRLGCTFPPGILEFYAECNGLSDMTDEGMWDFWSLDRLRVASADREKVLPVEPLGEVRACMLVLFCDALIEAVIYGFYADASSPHFGKFYSYQFGHSWEAASSYEDFVRVFLAQDPGLPWLPGG